MKSIKRWRYYCDYCKKSGGRRYYIEKHEKGCTKNPDRVCGMCEVYGESQRTSKELNDFIYQFIKTECISNWFDDNDVFEERVLIDGIEEKDVIEKLREFTNNCPACMLAAMRLTKTTWLFKSFDWKTERDRWQRDYNDSQSDY